MAITFSKRMLIERIQRYLNNGFPDTDFKVSANEILLHIDQVLAQQIIGKAYEGAKVEGVLVVPEAFYVTSSLPALVKDTVSGYWYTTLPQPPLSLPLGYSISNIFFANQGDGASQPLFPIEAKRVAYRGYMPLPTGARYWVEGSRLWVQASNNQPLTGQDLHVTMASSRTNDVNEPMTLPDDAIEGIFNGVVEQLIRRMQVPKDIIKDNLPAGSNNLKQ